MKSPQPRGPLGAAVLDALTAAAPRTDAPADDRLVQAARRAVEHSTDLQTDEDVQLTLFVLYELHYAGVEGVDDAWEWAPDLLRARAVLEEAFERELRARVTVPEGVAADRR